jgi:hypothetical protein
MHNPNCHVKKFSGSLLTAVFVFTHLQMPRLFLDLVENEAQVMN